MKISHESSIAKLKIFLFQSFNAYQNCINLVIYWVNDISAPILRNVLKMGSNT